MGSTDLFLSNMAVLREAARNLVDERGKIDPEGLRKQVIELLSQSPLSLAALSSHIKLGEQQVQEALNYLQDGKLVQERPGAEPGAPVVFELTPYAREALSFFSVKS